MPTFRFTRHKAPRRKELPGMLEKGGFHPSPLQEMEVGGGSTTHLVEALGTMCENTDVWGRSTPTGSTKKLPEPPGRGQYAYMGYEENMAPGSHVTTC